MLSRILQNITNDEDWEILARLCEYDGEFTLEELTQAGKIKAIKKKIAANYSVSVFVDIYNNEVYYDQLLICVAKTLKIEPIPKKLCSIKDFEIIEQLILGKYIKNIKDACIKEQGYSFWNEKEELAFSNIKKLSEELSLTEKEISEINDFQKKFDDVLTSNKVSSLIFFLLIRELINFEEVNNKENIQNIILTISHYSQYLILSNPLLSVANYVIDKEITKWKATTNTVLFLATLHLKQINADRLKKILDDN